MCHGGLSTSRGCIDLVPRAICEHATHMRPMSKRRCELGHLSLFCGASPAIRYSLYSDRKAGINLKGHFELKSSGLNILFRTLNY